MDLKAIRQAVANQINNGTGREVHAYPYPPGTVGELPAVVIRSGDPYINYFVTQGDECDVGLVLDILANRRVSLEEGLMVLDELLSVGAGLPNSVFDALEADLSLGGVVESCQLGEVGPHLGTFGTDGSPENVVVSVPLAVWVTRT